MSETCVNQSQTSMAPELGSTSTGLNIAVIGVGARANIAFNAVEVRPGTRTVAAADIAPAGRERAKAMFGDIPVYNNIDELIAAGGFDAVIVTTGDDSHAEIAVKLLRAGIPSYIEKPLAITLEDADAVL
ncbi:MAG: Gfo/Idh/MocA family oxidoreductase, partial [Promicromonosporaceae bacterium]|nr:Gfo/Idh/MocA family oxidoreductase [Promicromonosporaceae bacterium]